MTSSNFIKESIIAGKSDFKNSIQIGADIFKNATGIVGLATIGAGIVGGAAWAIPVVSILVGQSSKHSKEVLDNDSVALQKGAKHYASAAKKLVWDPVHKMMVKA